MMPSGSNRNKQSKTVVGIVATAYLRIEDMNYDQYRSATREKKLVPIYVVLLQSFWKPLITSCK
jgi:hypothetical protein